MNPDPIDRFLSTWETLPQSGDECLSHENLIQVAKGTSNEGTEHLKGCTECREIFQVIRDASTNKTSLMDEFIKRKADNAQIKSATRTHSAGSYLKALFWINQPRWAVFAALLLIAVLGFGYWSYRTEFRNRVKSHEITYLDRDDYLYAKETIHNNTRELPQSLSVSQRKPQHIAAINSNIAEVNDSIKTINQLYNQNRMNPEQRGEINDLLLTYRTRVAFLREGLTDSAQAKPVQQITTAPEITPDTADIMSVLTAIHQLNSKKNGPPEDSPQTELQQAEVIRSTNFEVVEIANEDSGTVLSLRPKVTEMSAAERGALESQVNANPFVSSRHVKLKILTEAYLPSSKTRSLTIPR